MKRIKFQTLAKLGTCMLLILLLVKVFIGEWVYIPSDSMFPTISAKSLVWNSKITYGALMPQRIVETPVLLSLVSIGSSFPLLSIPLYFSTIFNGISISRTHSGVPVFCLSV